MRFGFVVLLRVALRPAQLCDISFCHTTEPAPKHRGQKSHKLVALIRTMRCLIED